MIIFQTIRTKSEYPRNVLLEKFNSYSQFQTIENQRNEQRSV